MGGAARQHLPEPTGLWRVPGAHADAVGGGSPGALETRNVRSLRIPNSDPCKGKYNKKERNLIDATGARAK